MFNFNRPESIEPPESFPTDEEFLAKVSDLFNKVMYYKIDPMTKFHKLEKAHKNYFRIVSRPRIVHSQLDYGVYAGPDSPYDDEYTDDLCLALSEQRVLLYCLRAAAGRPIVQDENELWGVDGSLKEGMQEILGISFDFC